MAKKLGARAVSAAHEEAGRQRPRRVLRRLLDGGKALLLRHHQLITEDALQGGRLTQSESELVAFGIGRRERALREVDGVDPRHVLGQPTILPRQRLRAELSDARSRQRELRAPAVGERHRAAARREGRAVGTHDRRRALAHIDLDVGEAGGADDQIAAAGELLGLSRRLDRRAARVLDEARHVGAAEHERAVRASREHVVRRRLRRRRHPERGDEVRLATRRRPSAEPRRVRRHPTAGVLATHRVVAHVAVARVGLERTVGEAADDEAARLHDTHLLARRRRGGRRRHGGGVGGSDGDLILERDVNLAELVARGEFDGRHRAARLGGEGDVGDGEGRVGAGRPVLVPHRHAQERRPNRVLRQEEG